MNIVSKIVEMSVTLPAVLLAITFHEYAHGWVANRLGDPTAKLMGRLTLNPLSHLDPVGALALLIFKVGWAKPVPVNPFYLRNPRRDMVWVSAAGPGINIFLAAMSALIFRMMEGMVVPAYSRFFMEPFFRMVYWSVVINVALAVFNILPIPPLDGSRILSGLLPRDKALIYSRIEPYGIFILLGLIFIGAVDMIIWPAISIVTHVLLRA